MKKVTLQTLEGQKFYEFEIPASFSGGQEARPAGDAYLKDTFYLWLDKPGNQRLQVVIRPMESPVTRDFSKRFWALNKSEHQDATEIRLPGIFGVQFWHASYGGYLDRQAEIRSDNRQARFLLSYQGERGKSRSRTLETQLEQIVRTLKTL